MSNAIRIYQYRNCDSCRKALKWLDAAGLGYEAIDIVTAPPSQAELRDLWQRSGLPLPRLFNTSGQSYRQGGFKDRLKSMSDDEALAALAADGKLIKRPLLDAGAEVVIGFKADVYSDKLGG